MRRFALLTLTSLGCNQVFGLDPLARGDAAVDDAAVDDAAVGDAAVDDAAPDGPASCGAPIGTRPGGARVLSTSGLTLEAQAAGQVGSNRAIVGVVRDTGVLDGLVIRRAGAAANEAWRIGAIGGDLLVGAADDGERLLAVGTSRTGLVITEPDLALLTYVSSMGPPVAYRLGLAGDNLSATAAAAFAKRWVVAGRLRATSVEPLTAAAWVGVVAADGTVTDAIGLSLEATDDLRPRAVVTDATRGFVVGSRTNTSGLVFAYAIAGGAVPWATTLPFPAVGATLHDGQLLVSGALGPDGMLATLDPDTGMVVALARFPDARLHRLTSAHGALWVAGPATGGVFVGQLADGCATATLHTGFTIPTAYQVAQPLVVNPTGAVVYSTTAAGAIAERTIDQAGSSTCALAGFGSAGVAAAEATTTVTSPATERLTPATTPFTQIGSLAITTVTSCL